MNSAFYAQVRGRVQGVGFRYSTVREAWRLGLFGWVRNDSKGGVEVWAEGTPEKLSAFLAWLRRGPQFARVDAVDKEDKAPQGYTEFSVAY